MNGTRVVSAMLAAVLSISSLPAAAEDVDSALVRARRKFRLQIDPNDFLVPQVFDTHDERWVKSAAAEERIRSLCR